MMMKILLFFLSIVPRISSVSYNFNRPRFDLNVSWNPNATTFANLKDIVVSPRAIFIDLNNTVYVPAPRLNEILIFSEMGTNHQSITGVLLHDYGTVFVSMEGDVYFQSKTDKYIYKRSKNSTENILSTNNTRYDCFGLFIDINNILYCSTHHTHQILAISLNTSNSSLEVIAGKGSMDSSASGLWYPYGIFVNTNFDIYVADWGNNRIQLFARGQKNATTVAGNGNPQKLKLEHPMDVILDADNYLFIVEADNHRIIRSGPHDYQCIAGCNTTAGASVYQLYLPHALRFDNYGNIYVADHMNQRIQKFNLITNFSESQMTREQTNSTFALMSYSSTISDIISTEIISFSNQENRSSMCLIPNHCRTQSTIGFKCNISGRPCDMLAPCPLNATCINNSTNPNGFFCLCPSNFSGNHCEIDHRRCKPNLCQNNGTCNETSTDTSPCQCAPHWQGYYCERKINYCSPTTCQNNGVCRPILGGYICECLGIDYYSGKHCEKLSTKIYIYKFVSKSFAYVAILALVSVALFVIVMDILKYCFGIDPVEHERELIRRKKQKHKPVIERFVYVNKTTTTTV